MKSFFQLIFALALCGILGMSYNLWYTSVEAKSIELADLTREVSAKQTVVDRAIPSSSVLSEIARDEVRIRRRFVPEEEIASFVTTLENRAHSLGATFKIQSVSTGGSVSRPKLSFDVTLTGEFDSLMRTIGSMEHMAFDLSVSALTITRSGDSWQANLTLEAGALPKARDTQS